MMNLVFESTDAHLLNAMQDEWNKIPDAFFMTHYELNKAAPKFDALSWRKFLTDPQVADWLKDELRLIQEAKLRSILKDLDENSRSTGLPQLINTLANQIDRPAHQNDGPIFVYIHTPLNDQEKNAPNVQIAGPDAIKDITDF